MSTNFLLLSEAGINPKILIHHRSSKVPKGTDGIGNVRSNQVCEEALSETQLAKHTILVTATSESAALGFDLVSLDQG